MQSSQRPLSSEQQKSPSIELIFIGQVHKVPGTSPSIDYEDTRFDCQEVVYSQLSIMKTIMDYPDAVIVPEGSIADVTYDELKPHEVRPRSW